MQPCVYILSNRPNGILYTGVTSALEQRMGQHTQGLIPGFTKRYGISRLVYYEVHVLMPDAITREHRIKQWKRAWKVRLIQSMNPEWRDLFDPTTGELLDGPADVARLTDRHPRD